MDQIVETGLKLLIVLVLVAANGFFVAVEFALVSVRRSRVEEMVRQNMGTGRLLQRALNDLDRYIAGAQIGITLASIALGWIGEPTLEAMFRPAFESLPKGTAHAIAIGLSYSLITALHVVLGEQVPKCFAIQKAEAAAIWLSRPMAASMWLFRPLIWVLNGASNAVLTVLGLQAAGEHQGVHSAEELEILVRQSHEAGVLDDLERQMLQQTFRFGELTAKDVMIPRPDMDALDASQPSEQLFDRAAQSIHTRLPVYDGDIDNIIGVLHLHDLFKHMRRAPGEVTIRGLLRPPLVVPESVHLDALLEQFRAHKSQIAVVVDEHGGTAGLATLEDVVEEVFGELQDMLEAEQPSLQNLPDGRILVRGHVRLDEIGEFCEWVLEDEEADTVAGYVMNRLGRTARVGDTVEAPDGLIRVENMARHRITQVALIRRQ